MSNYKSSLIIKYEEVENLASLRTQTAIVFLDGSELIVTTESNDTPSASYGDYVELVSAAQSYEITIDLPQAYLDGQINEQVRIFCSAEYIIDEEGSNDPSTFILSQEYDGALKSDQFSLNQEPDFDLKFKLNFSIDYEEDAEEAPVRDNYKSDLTIRYTWAGDISDVVLDTTIPFKSSIANIIQEYEMDPPADIAPYITVNSQEELLEIVVDLQQAYLDGEINETISIDCFAGLIDDLEEGEPQDYNINLEWEYDGEFYNKSAKLRSNDDFYTIDEVAIKTIRVSSLNFVFNPYSDNIIYQFDPIFYLNTNDLSEEATGYAIHRNRDVTFVFDITDRQKNVLNSPSALLESPFLRELDIDILDVSGNTIIDNYVSGSFENSFTFTEQDNIDVFGFYTPNFGVGISAVGENINVHSSKYFVYANPLEIEEIYVTDRSGLWLNNNPIQFQSYVPYETFGESIDGQLVTNNALYISGYRDRVTGYSAEISGSVPFAILSGESLKIDWGLGQIDTVFIQTGLDGFSGIDGVSVTNTFTGDPILTVLVDPTGLNGQAYSFVTGYSYEETGIYDVNFYYSGIGSTGDELIKTLKYRIPDELKAQGKLQIGDASIDAIQFEVQFQNETLYTKADTLEVYASTVSGNFDIANEFVTNQVVPVLSEMRNYSFFLDNRNITAETPYWFKIAPSGAIGSGYAWEVGPYSFFYPPAPKTNVSSDSFSLTNGGFQADIDFITGSVETDLVTTIDILPKGEKYSYEYFAQFKDVLGHHCSSKIIIVDNTSGQDDSRTGLAFEEYSRSENSFANYSVSGDEDNIYLNAQLDYPVGFYKLYKTSI
jgi:hypothetical protein